MKDLKALIKRIRNKLGGGTDLNEREDEIQMPERIPTSLDMMKEPLSSSLDTAGSLTNKKSDSPLHTQNRYKRRDRATVALIFLISMLNCTGYSFIGILLPDEARKKGASPAIIGAIAATSPFVVVVLSPAIGRVVHIIGLKLLIVASLVLVGSALILIGFVILIPIEWLFIVTAFLVQMVHGLGTSMFYTTIYTLISTIFLDSVGTVMGINDLFIGVGFALGFPLGGLLYELGGFQLPFAVMGLTLIAMAIVCVILLRKVEVIRKRKIKTPKNLILNFATDPIFILQITIDVLGTASVGFIIPNLQTYLIDNFHLNSTQVGLVAFPLALSYLVSALFVGFLTDRLGHHRWFNIAGLSTAFVGYCIQAAPYFIGSPIGWWYSVITNTVIGSGAACSVVSVYKTLFKIAQKYAKNDDEKSLALSIVSGTITSVITFGEVSGNLIGGLLNNFLSFSFSSLVFAEILLAEIVVVVSLNLMNQFL